MFIGIVKVVVPVPLKVEFFRPKSNANDRTKAERQTVVASRVRCINGRVIAAWEKRDKQMDWVHSQAQDRPLDLPFGCFTFPFAFSFYPLLPIHVLLVRVLFGATQ